MHVCIDQVAIYLGAPLTAYGSESLSRAHRRHTPHKKYIDVFGKERIQVEEIVSRLIISLSFHNLKPTNTDCVSAKQSTDTDNIVHETVKQVQFHTRGPLGHAIVTADADAKDFSFKFLYVDIDSSNDSNTRFYRPIRLELDVGNNIPSIIGR